ncbi:hypothetical protein ACS0TY_029511 [Phlomoides rotata]
MNPKKYQFAAPNSCSSFSSLSSLSWSSSSRSSTNPRSDYSESKCVSSNWGRNCAQCTSSEVNQTIY